MKNTLRFTLIALLFAATSCMDSEVPEPEVIIDWPQPILVSRDSITTGDYQGFRINADGASTYASVQGMLQKGISSVNVVGNSTGDLGQVASRIPLYKYILLDESKGTESGVQISLESGIVTSIYLNSGKKLSQWPTNEKANSSVRLGDKARNLYNKLVQIQGNKKYAHKFERISLQTKDLLADYDPAMSALPQWYFRYEVSKGLYEDVKIHLENGKVKYLEVSRYKDPI